MVCVPENIQFLEKQFFFSNFTKKDSPAIHDIVRLTPNDRAWSMVLWSKGIDSGFQFPKSSTSISSSRKGINKNIILRIIFKKVNQKFLDY